MTENNRYGLSRHIPAETKREIRRACGFGCVCCGLAIASYEHIIPEFKDARDHDPERMALLCENCHSRVTRGVWSKDKVREARKRPWCVERNRCHDAFDISNERFAFWPGGKRCVGINTILRIEGEDILTIEPPEAERAPYRVSARFNDATGTEIFRIERNEWCGRADAWDIEAVGPRLFIRAGPGKIALQIHCIPPEELVIERIDMLFGGTRIHGTADKLIVAGFCVDGYADVVGESTPVFITAPNETGAGGQIGGAGKLRMSPRKDGPPKRPFQAPAEPGRNDRCPCGSGRKYKKCHGAG